jgi:spore coat polysaccharide biosynthesis protein SpsF
MPGAVAIIQARMGSSRLPGKVLKLLGEHPVIWHVVERCRRSSVDAVWVATSDTPADDVLAQWCTHNSVAFYRGSEDDVLSRYVAIAALTQAERLVRVTGDCPLIAPEIIDLLLGILNDPAVDYAHVKAEEKYPDALPRGLNTEVFWRRTLEAFQRRATSMSHREHVTLLVEDKSQGFRIRRVPAPEGMARPGIRLTLDTPDDYVMLQSLFQECPITPETPLEALIACLDQHPEIVALNKHVQQKPV